MEHLRILFVDNQSKNLSSPTKKELCKGRGSIGVSMDEP